MSARNSGDVLGDRLEHNTHGENFQAMRGDDAYSDEGELREEYLQTLVEHGLDETTAALFQNLLTKDFVLSNITSAEKTEMTWLVRLMREKIISEHPPKDSPVQGEMRKFYYDDEDALALRPLSGYQEQLIEQAIYDIIFRLRRSVEGWQQQELSSQYRVSRVDREREEKGSRLGGLFQ